MLNPFTAAARPHRDQGNIELARRIETEGRIVGKLVTAALKAGYTVSVNDGEEWVLKCSTKRAEIMAALFSTDEDVIVIRHGSKQHVGSANKPGDRVGFFSMIYGNCGYDVIHDYTANDACEALYRIAMRNEG